MISIEHPDHPIPVEIAATRRALNDYYRAETERADQLVAATRPTPEERQELRSLRAAGISGPSHERQAIYEDFCRRQSARILQSTGMREDVTPWLNIFLNEFPPTPPPPPATDHSFWWARSDATVDSPYTIRFLNDGLHIGGELTHQSGALISRHVGLTALFELQSARIPRSPSGSWASQPWLEMFGGVLGHIPRGHFWIELPFVSDSDDDCWAKCWIVLRQLVYQIGFGPDGPIRMVRGSASRSLPLVVIENSSNDNVLSPSHPQTRFVQLPGAVSMPSLILRDVSLGDSLWAELSVQVDVQLEGDGSSIQMAPEVLVRTFQWPLLPI